MKFWNRNLGRLRKVGRTFENVRRFMLFELLNLLDETNQLIPILTTISKKTKTKAKSQQFILHPSYFITHPSSFRPSTIALHPYPTSKTNRLQNQCRSGFTPRFSNAPPNYRGINPLLR
jgi:hypothetical protein